MSVHHFSRLAVRNHARPPYGESRCSLLRSISSPPWISRRVDRLHSGLLGVSAPALGERAKLGAKIGDSKPPGCPRFRFELDRLGREIASEAPRIRFFGPGGPDFSPVVPVLRPEGAQKAQVVRLPSTKNRPPAGPGPLKIALTLPQKAGLSLEIPLGAKIKTDPFGRFCTRFRAHYFTSEKPVYPKKNYKFSEVKSRALRAQLFAKKSRAIFDNDPKSTHF